jgi:hypothetical protein
MMVWVRVAVRSWTAPGSAARCPDEPTCRVSYDLHVHTVVAEFTRVVGLLVGDPVDQAQVTASRPRPSNPPMTSPSLSLTAASTGCYVVCAGKVNASSRFWSAAGRPCVTVRSALEESATSSRQPYTSLISNTATSANSTEITSLDINLRW